MMSRMICRHPMWLRTVIRPDRHTLARGLGVFKKMGTNQSNKQAVQKDLEQLQKTPQRKENEILANYHLVTLSFQ